VEELEPFMLGQQCSASWTSLSDLQVHVLLHHLPISFLASYIP
jgi:hypothetical protein